jgi:SNF family Na+-dependent transporter
MLELLHKLTSNKWHQHMYKYFLYISYVLFILSLLGITLFKTNYLDILNKLIKIYIAVILIIRFNPFITTKLDKQNIEFDREISFSAGILLLLSMIVTTYITQILDYVDFASDMF